MFSGNGNASGSILEFYQTGTGPTAKTIVTADPAFYEFYIELEGHHTLTSADFIFTGLTGTAGDDVLTGTGIADAIAGLDGNDSLTGNSGNDFIEGGAGNDTIYGNNDDDELHGGDGDDYIHGGVGADTIYGGAGNDTIVTQRNVGALDSIYGGAGDDTYLWLDSATAEYSSAAWGMVINDFTLGEDVIELVGKPIDGIYLNGTSSSRDMTRANELSIYYHAGTDQTVIQTNYSYYFHCTRYALTRKFCNQC